MEQPFFIESRRIRAVGGTKAIQGFESVTLIQCMCS